MNTGASTGLAKGFSFVAPGFRSFALGLLTLAVLWGTPGIARAGGPAFTDANWVSLPGPNGYINTTRVGFAAAVLDTNGNLYVGGFFTNVGGVGANYVAEWNGTTWKPLGPGVNGPVYSLTFDTAGNLYAGGLFTTAGGLGATNVAKWDGTNWFNLGLGMSEPTANWPLAVYALACGDGGNLYAGGSFMKAGGTNASSIARWTGSTWSALGLGISNGVVLSLACGTNGNLYAGGLFTSADGVNATNIAEWSGSAWSALGSGTPSLALGAICLDASGNLYAGGESVDDTSGSTLTKWNGTNWSSLGSGMSNIVYSLAFRSPNLYACGGFISLDGVSGISIAIWNGSSWSALGSGINGPVSALAFDALGNMYAAGTFSLVGTNSATNIAKALLVGPTPNQLTLTQSGPATNVVTYLGTPGATYALDLATNLTTPMNWMPQATNVTSTNNAATAGYLTLTNLSAAPQAFYRIRSVP